MSSTDSSALCKIKVNGGKVSMDCQSKEKFSISPIIFESTIIKKDGKDIFLLSNYSTTDQFSCIISTVSEEARAPTPTPTLRSTPTPTSTPIPKPTPTSTPIHTPTPTSIPIPTPTSTQTPTPAPVSTTTPGEDEGKSGEHNRYYSNSSSKGLTGGAIAGIIITCLAAVAIVTALIVLTKKGVFASKNAGLENSVNHSPNSTVDVQLRFDTNNK